MMYMASIGFLKESLTPCWSVTTELQCPGTALLLPSLSAPAPSHRSSEHPVIHERDLQLPLALGLEKKLVSEFQQSRAARRPLDSASRDQMGPACQCPGCEGSRALKEAFVFRRRLHGSSMCGAGRRNRSITVELTGPLHPKVHFGDAHMLSKCLYFLNFRYYMRVQGGALFLTNNSISGRSIFIPIFVPYILDLQG